MAPGSYNMIGLQGARGRVVARQTAISSLKQSLILLTLMLGDGMSGENVRSATKLCCRFNV